MKTLTLQIDEMNNIHVIDEDNQFIEKEQEALDYIWSKIEFARIGRVIMQENDLAEDPKAIKNLGKIIQNYFAEKEQFLETNKETILRLALKDTEEDIEIGK